jgi:hypothetical protein
MVRTEAEIVETNKEIEKVLMFGPDFALTWLRGAFHTHKEQIAFLLKDIKQLQQKFLLHVSRPLSVEEARMCNVCRVCRCPYSAPFTMNYGEEFAHTKCINSDGKSE